MQRKGLSLIITVAVVSAIISFIIADIAFKSPGRNTKIPQVEAIKATFPDVKNDSAYSSFLNANSLDATQPVQIGGTQNTNPF